ncbi:MAG: VOC family protein [Gammaproteobacteria bacterium]
MIAIDGIYELVIKVADLARAEAFYRDLLGLEDGYRDDERDWVFLRCPGDTGMVVLQKEFGPIREQHFAFRVSPSEFVRASEILKEKHLTSEGPIFHEWMPANSIYFRDPDGHEVEFCAPGLEIAAE